MKKSILSFILAVLLLFVAVGCGNATTGTGTAAPAFTAAVSAAASAAPSSAGAAKITSDLKITGTGIDITITASELNSQTFTTLTCTNIDSAGKVTDATVVCFDLFKYLESKKVDTSSITALNLVASDGYQMAVPKDTYSKSGVYIAVAINGEYFDQPRTCLPDQRAQFWVKMLSKIEIVGGGSSGGSSSAAPAAAASVKQIQMFRELAKALDPVDQDNNGYTVKAYALSKFYEKYMDAKPTSPVTMKALDGFSKTETPDVFLSNYIAYEAQKGKEGDLPLYFSSTLAAGMRVKQLDVVISGSEAIYFGTETKLADLLKAAGMSSASGYQFVASDGYTADIPAAAVSYGKVYFDRRFWVHDNKL